MKQTYPGISNSISDWKGQEITDFQEELLRQVNAHISEKWFYTHMKGNRDTLPRVDILNLLSRFVGYKNFDDFCFHHQGESVEADPVPQAKSTANRYFVLVPVLVVAAVALFFWIVMLFNTREYRFCFVDADTREPITGSKISVTILVNGESPLQLMADATGCLSYKTSLSRITMVVSAPYYRPDTIERMVKKFNREELIMLHANDYALMIHYFSEMKVDDWQKRRNKLEEMFAENAKICQLIGGTENPGMVLYTRDEFIDRMTMPVGSLQHIEILDTRLRQEKIVLLRFRVNKEK
jgi:hypothetical protein